MPGAARTGAAGHVEDQPLWSMAELQELLDEWLIALWLNRPHDGLRDPEHPGQGVHPEREVRGPGGGRRVCPGRAVGPGDYVELLPASWRAVNAYGDQAGNRRSYDSEDLNPLRLQPSGVRREEGPVGGPARPRTTSPESTSAARGMGWITVFWKHLNRAPVPFGELAWDHVSRSLGREATEEQIADAVAALLRRASAGPGRSGEAEDRQARPPGCRPHQGSHPAGRKQDQPESGGPAQPGRAAGQAEQDPPLAKVIPMPIFDPFAEADKPW